MIPGVNDPQWGRLLDTLGGAQVRNLATKMLFNRIKLRLGMDAAEATRKQAIAEIREYMLKNEAAIQDELQALFGK